MNWLIKNLLRGLVIVVPVALTIYLLYRAFITLDRILGLPVPGVGLLLILAGLIAVGALAGNFVGRRLFHLMEKIFTKAPIVRIIYGGIRDLLEAFVGNKRRFDRAVSVSVTEGVKVFGFITRDELASLKMPGHVAVYVPFSYTWDGCLLVVERERVQAIDADSASIMALVVSGGVSRV